MEQPGAPQAPVELKSRARIRDAALKQFAVHGFKGATFRGIAREAGVSPGRVQHHFPSKQVLRDECDAYVLTFLRTAMSDGAVGGAVADAGFVADTHRTVSLLVPYLAMSLISDAATAPRWFDELAELHHGVLTGGKLGIRLPEGEDVEAIAAVYTAMELGLAILSRHIYRRLGADESDPTATARIGRARLFLATERLIGAELAAAIKEGLDRYQRME
ncbi:TetR/AcrR family transcriptional regulator [Nonomuraea turcica]|uniref:TetR/AcrR family transcriptional regulator n=1 Tax=Nonomuraea sp. G32 TaxID=3067274 RepID=UPI00273C4A31|nr:TetR/AcrR family transcriptional regulator [Nonomuraea sp. G32]MDP4503392.1 helix-turn-helix domain-containing protein [Nonomuraea sp. G32]